MASATTAHIVVMSNGGFGGVRRRLADALQTMDDQLTYKPMSKAHICEVIIERAA